MPPWPQDTGPSPSPHTGSCSPQGPWLHMAEPSLRLAAGARLHAVMGRGGVARGRRQRLLLGLQQRRPAGGSLHPFWDSRSRVGEWVRDRAAETVVTSLHLPL